MQPPFDFVHLDPSSDPPEPYQDAVELFCELWAKLRGFQSRCAQDQVLLAVIRDLEHRLIAAGLILAIQLELLNDR
ncbi:MULTISPECIES: hypothetical protein [unclassified Bradyrhizobium]|uniref:hypothetical protein n=1 Tax=unclassified Bradyrhizobium TaxID=2631580 RepID=UPI001FF80405|nr:MULTISPECIES: hypothetical protein [unclassified Bradyrhizobium]MCK1538193.1 hypothetical protein [Bradyrhizobium sp. 176]MCK1562385.1 hypothetical protein [Bradyrhizobium sp. 171]